VSVVAEEVGFDEAAGDGPCRFIRKPCGLEGLNAEGDQLLDVVAMGQLSSPLAIGLRS
jgi:hypothetical protein